MFAYGICALQIEHIVSTAHKNGSKLRVVGSALSPNGLGLPDDGADTLSMALMDKCVQRGLTQRFTACTNCTFYNVRG